MVTIKGDNDFLVVAVDVNIDEEVEVEVEESGKREDREEERGKTKESFKIDIGSTIDKGGNSIKSSEHCIRRFGSIILL